jgi:DNA-nicking Smr family endonuclease
MIGDDADEPWVVPIEDTIDLHAFAPRDVVAVVGDYLEAAHARGFREVRLIHGRGKGVQRGAVQRLLAGHPLVHRFWDAPESHLGATLVELVGDSPGSGPTHP